VSSQWLATSELSSEQRLDVLNLLNRTEVLLGREAIDEGRRRNVVHGWKAEHYLQHANGQLTHYVQSTTAQNATVEMCGGGFDEDLLSLLLQTHLRVDWWTRDQAAGELARGEIIRRLLLLEIDLPIAASNIPEGSTLRTFVVGDDEDAWLVQNNEAFADHPEQGAWKRADLEERTREPWFDPSGFLILDIDNRIAASCWTKVHELSPQRFGEIYVISVHPDFQGRSLGKVMVTQGLRVLREKGVQKAKLFVDESNAAAISLYTSLGFRREREDQLRRFTR